MLVALITTTASLNLLYNPQTPTSTKVSTAKANTYQFVPTSGSLITGTEQNANSLLAAAAEGVNTGSWKGTLADDNFHWQVTAADSGTPNLNMQLDLGTARLANANKLVIQTEVDLDSASRTLKIQICDWVSSTSVDAAADSECTTGGWRSLNSQNASNADVDIALTTGAAFQWHIFDGYFSSGTGGGTTISTPLTNFTDSDTEPIRIRYWSDADVTGTGDVAIDFLRANAFVDSVYHPAGAVNLNVSGGALTGTYANAHVVGNSATAQQSVTAGNAVYLTGAGTAGSVADFYLQFKNVKTYTGANTFYFKADYSCSAATAGLDHKFQIYNFTTTTWVDLNSAVIACSTTDATNAWAENNITPSDFIDESASDEVRVRFLGDLNSTTTLRIDFAYLILGSTNTDSGACELTWGAGTATDCTNTRDLVGPAAATVFSSGTAEEKSNTYNRDYYALDCPASATAGECAAANIDFPVTVPSDAQVVVNHFAGRFAGDLVGTTNPDLTVQMGIRDYSGAPTSTAGPGGWTLVGATSATSTQVYTDSITAMVIGTYGMQINPDDHVDTVNNEMNLRLRTTVEGRSADDSRFEWDFAMVSIGWVVDSSHPTRNYQFAPTGDTLVAGAETARLGLTASATSGVNTGGWQGTLNDDNLHWSVAGANVVGTNYDVQLNFATAKQNGANKLLIQTEVDADANIALLFQICDWVSTTSVDSAADANCTGGGWRTLNSQNASNADVTYTDTASDALQWHIFDGYFTTGTTGGSAISTPLNNFFHSSNGVKLRYFSTTQSSTNLDVDFVRIQPIIDSVYHPSGVTNLNVSGGALAGTYANAHVVGNSATAQQATTTGDAVYLTGAGTAGSVADYYLSFTNIKTYQGANTFYFKADYSCSAATAGLDHQFAIYNFTTPGWENLNSAAIACATSDATHAWAKNNITLSDYLNGGEARIRFFGDLNSTTTLRLDFAYLVVGSTNTDTADCAVTFGTGTASNCTSTRDLVGPGTASSFNNPAEDESATMGTGDSNAYYAFDNETTPDTTVEESTSANLSFPVTQPTNSSVVGQNYAARFSGCGNTGAACGAATLTVQLGFKDYSGFNAAVGGWLQIGGTSASSTLAYTDTITALGIAAYGQQISPEDYIDTADNKVNLRLRTTTPGTNTSNVTTVWDFAMVSLQWIEIGNTIDIAGSSSVSGATVAVAVDGLLQVGKTASTSGTCPCAWSITSVFVAGDRPVLVWHDGASDANESSGITVYDGSGNISGMQLTAHTLSVGSGDDQNVDSADLIKFDNDADEDVMYKFVTSTLTVDATSTYASDTIDILSGDTLTIGGSETMVAYNIAINGTLTSGGATAYTVQGDWVNNGTFNEGTSTVTFNGTTSEDLNSGCSNFDTCTAQNFYNLTINKTAAGASDDNLSLLTNHLRVTNTLTITDGELIQGTLNVRVEGSSAVSIAAAGTWTNISTGDLKLGGTFVNAGAATFNSNNGTQCVDGADDIVISSTSGGSQRAWSGAGTFTLYNVNVTDMTDSSITAYTSSFSNTTWTEGSCGISITGTCDQYDRSTDCTDDGSNQFRVAINGSLQAQVDTTVDGTINITGVTAPNNGDIVTVFIDGNADTNEAVAVTKYDGSGNISGIVLYQRHLTLGSDDNPTLSNADIDAYDNSVSADEDIFFDIDGNDDLTVDAVSTYTDEYLYIKSSTIYRPGASNSSNVNATHLEIDGTLQADGNIYSINGNWQNDGTFTANTSQVTFTSTSTGRTLAGAMTGSNEFYNLTFSGSGGGWTFSAAVETGNDFTLNIGTITASNNNLTVGRDFLIADTSLDTVIYNPGSSTINITRHFTSNDPARFAEDTSTVQMSGTGTITYGNGGDFHNLSVGYTSNTTTFSNNNWDLYGTLTFNGGTVSGGGSYISLRRSSAGSSVTFASATTINGTQTLYHVAEGGSSYTYTITGGNYGSWSVVPHAAVNSVTYSLGGNLTSTGFVRLEANDAVTGSAFNTSGSNYSITASYLLVAPCAPTRTGSWAVDFNDSTITLSSTASSLYVGTNCGSHTLDLDTSDVTVNGSVSFVNGTGTIAITPGSSDFTFAPTASQTETYAPNGQSLWNMIINGANAAATVMPTAAVDVNNNFTITAGTYDTDNFGDFPLTIGNNYSNSGTFTARNANVTFDATDTGNTLGGTMTGSSAFYTLTFNGSGGEWTPSAAVTITDNLILTNGSLLGTQDITVNKHVRGDNTGLINLTGGTFEQRVSADRDIGGSVAWTFNNLTFSNSSGTTPFTVSTYSGHANNMNVTGILRVGKSGDTQATTLAAGNRTWTLSGTGGDPFQILASPAGDLTPETSTFTYTGNNGSGDTTIQSETYNNIIINNGSETYNLEAATFGSDVTITAGTLALNGQTLNATNDLAVNGTLSGSTNVTVNGSVTGSGTINLSGGTFTQRITANANETFGSTSGANNWTFNNLTFRNSDTNNHSITINPTGSGQIIIGATATFGSGTDTNTVTVDFDTNDRILDVNGSVDITNRGILEPSSSASFTVGDNWTNSGTFNHNNGTVTFDTTTTATFAGATTFYNFTSTTAAKTLEFTAAQTFTIDTGGLLTLTGAADPNEIQIKSTTPTSQWFINHQGTESVSYVQVVDSGCDVASTQISTSNSVDDGNNGSCWLFGSTFEQADYRFGEDPEDSSTGIIYSGPAENTAYTSPGTTDGFRLRMLIHVGGSNLAQNGETFKLQFGEKTAANCTTGVSWADVSPSSGVIRYLDAAPADGDNISSVAGDPDHSGHTKQYQDFEEANNFTNSVSAINSGQDGVWAFSLVNHSAVGGKRYCFKAVKSTGADLDTYSFYPEVIIDEELVFSLDATSKNFGVVQPGDNPTNQTSTVTVTTNSATGYVVYAWSTQAMTKGAHTIPDWSGTNATPTSFPNGSFGFGYSTDDSTLTGGTADRFTNGGAKYAGFIHNGPGDPVADRTSGPVVNEQNTITYRLAGGVGQQAGTYTTVVVYVVATTF